MKFKYNKKETYTDADIEEILSQHAKFTTKQYDGYKSPDEVKELSEKLSTFETEKRNTHIASIAKGLTRSGLEKDAILLAGINPEDDDDTVKNKLQATVKERKFLQIDNSDTFKETGGKSNSKEEESSSLEGARI